MEQFVLEMNPNELEMVLKDLREVNIQFQVMESKSFDGGDTAYIIMTLSALLIEEAGKIIGKLIENRQKCTIKHKDITITDKDFTAEEIEHILRMIIQESKK